MSWWVQMLAMLAACLRFGAAEEGDPLPAALVELVRSSPISSLEDLQLLLFSDSVDGEEEGSPANEGHRLPRSLDAQPAQQALCKVRTEVVEVTRAMLDRSNANFLLWPPCVEVQRCSGCCNTKSLQCVPVLTHTRYLQVMKIQYVNKRPTYAKAVVSVVDHVECRCQPAPRPPVLRKKSSRRQQTHSKEQHRNQTLSQGQGKARSKETLHHQDELKHHQRVQLEELLERHWSPRGDTFTPSEEAYSLAGEEDTSQSRENIVQGPHWVYNATRLLGTKDGTDNNNQENAEDGKHGRLAAGNRTLSVKERDGFIVDEASRGVEGDDGLAINSTEGRMRTEWRPSYDGGNVDRKQAGQGTQTDGPSLQNDKTSKTHHRASESSERVTTRYPQHGLGLTTKAPDQRGGENVWLRPTKEPNPDPPRGGQDRRRDNETPEEGKRLQTDEERLEQEKKELLLLHKRLDQEKEHLRQQQLKREEEERERDDRESRRHHPHNKEHHQPQTTTQKTETMTTATTQPVLAPAGPRPPARPNPPRKRMRKNRKRISKAAMRAMLM